MIFTGCDGLINSMKTDDDMNLLNIEDTAMALDDLITMGLNSEDGLITVTFNADNTGHEVSVETGSGYTCVSMDSGLSFPYGAASWDASFMLTMNGCGGDSGSIYNGTISVNLAGPPGSVTSFGFSGILNLSGTTNGNIVMNIQYDLDYDCIVNWDCWSGTVNGYTVAALYNAYIN